MNLKTFRDKVRYYRRLTGQSQQALAEAIGLYPTVLSAKLNGTDQTHLLNHPEIKRIIQTLAEWEAITQQAEAQELLELVNLKLSVFSPQEWQTSPLNRLDTLPNLELNKPKGPPLPLDNNRGKDKDRSDPTPKVSTLEHPQPQNPFFITPARPTTFPALRTLEEPPTNLPHQMTSFVGRELEIQQVGGILRQPEARLLTLTGPGGTGKTRLSLRVAEELRLDFTHGIFFVALAVITEPELVISAISQVLGVTESEGTSPHSVLATFLRDKQMLLILDNFEQIVEAAPLVTELLGAAPRLKILVTSRSLLDLYGEYEYIVPPLALPDPRMNATLEKLEQYAAVKLFVQRARAVQPAFTLNPDNASAVVEICARLDGLPLAVELAAARSKLLSPQKMLPLLDKRLSLVTGGARNLPKRQQTLRNTIEWSFDLLDPDEQRLFRWLSVFAGSFSLEAAAAICGEPENPLLVQDTLPALLHKSLLRQIESAEDEARFGMLETIHEYASELLLKSGEEEKLHQAHVQYYLEWAEMVEPKLHSTEQSRWVNRLEQDHNNLRLALQWSLEHNAAELAGTLSGRLNWFWYIHSHVSEGRRWLDKILAATSTLTTQTQAKVLQVAGQFAHVQGDYKRAIPYANQSIALYRQLNDKLNLARSLRNRGVSAVNTSNYPEADVLLAEALSLFHEVNNGWGIVMTTLRLGNIAFEQGHYERARLLLNETLARASLDGDDAGVCHAKVGLGELGLALGEYQEVDNLADDGLRLAQGLGDRNLMGWNLWNKAGAALGQGLLVAAYTFAAQSYAIWQAIDDEMGLALALTRQGAIAVVKGDFVVAADFYSQGLKLWQSQNGKRYCAICLEGLAQIATRQGQYKQAVCLWGAAAAIRQQFGTPLSPSDQPEYERAVAWVRQQLTEADWKTAWEQGGTLNLDRAVNYALGLFG